MIELGAERRILSLGSVDLRSKRKILHKRSLADLGVCLAWLKIFDVRSFRCAMDLGVVKDLGSRSKCRIFGVIDLVADRELRSRGGIFGALDCVAVRDLRAGHRIQRQRSLATLVDFRTVRDLRSKGRIFGVYDLVAVNDLGSRRRILSLGSVDLGVRNPKATQDLGAARDLRSRREIQSQRSLADLADLWRWLNTA